MTARTYTTSSSLVLLVTGDVEHAVSGAATGWGDLRDDATERTAGVAA
jgi:hypothetical protein